MTFTTVFWRSGTLSIGSIRFSLKTEQIWLIINRWASFSEKISVFAANRIEKNIRKLICVGLLVISSLISLRPC